MKREHIAALVTVVAIIAVVVFLAARDGGGGRHASIDSTGGELKPGGVVRDLFQLAKKGDTEGYLACFDTKLRESVEASARDMGEAAFAAQIEDLGNDVKGVAVSQLRADSRDAELRVELVYADRGANDVQTFTVRRKGDRWLIASMSRAETVVMPIPYGTPAYPLELDAEPAPESQE